jgi:putative transposase
MAAAQTLARGAGVSAACTALNVARATYYRRQQPALERPPRPAPPLKLTEEERQTVLDVLHSPRFADLAPRSVYATLLDEDQTYHCSARTMYRILASENEVRERRNQLRHPQYKKPELVATGPNQVWTWDITQLKGPEKWTYFYLYVVLDLYSRLVVGWLTANRECSLLANSLISQSYEKQGIEPGQLTLHADRGPSMRSKPVAFLLADLGITKSHNRPYTSNDNPFSEAQFKTVKYHSRFPERFGSLVDTRVVCGPLLNWYNTEHRHSSLAYLTPADVHYGRAAAILAQREAALLEAFESQSSRFKGHIPKAGKLPLATWINPPKPSADTASVDGAPSAAAPESSLEPQ